MPLQLFAYDEFFIRFSNNQFTMEETTFQEYDTHFTVMNYGAKLAMTNMRYFDFIKAFDEEYKDRNITWAELNQKAHRAIADVFTAFQTRYGKEILDAGNLDKARACYGVDVMID